MKSYAIILTKEELDDLHDDYSMVEVVVEKIVKQAQLKGYVPPKKKEQPF
jgi:hypothetical protein